MPEPEYPDLDPHTERLVVVTGIDLVRRIGNLRRAFDAAQDAVDRQSGEEVYHVEAFLASAAAISVVFWPARRKQPDVERARTLRSLFKVPEDSPLRSRAVRCAFIHHDERSDGYLLDDDRPVIDPTIRDRPPSDTSAGAGAVETLTLPTMTASYLDEEVGMNDLKDAGDQLLTGLWGVSRQLDDVLSSAKHYYDYWVAPPADG